MAFKMKSGNKPAFKFMGSSPDIKEDLDRKYGLGEYSRGGDKFDQRMLSGESKYQYNVRMQKARNKASRSAGEQKSKSSMPDPKTEIKGLQGQQPLWAQSDPLGINKNPNDLRRTKTVGTTELPSAPGDPYKYEIDMQTGEVGYIDPEGNYHYPELGSAEDKAIRERYTGSETGDLSNWYGYSSDTNIAMETEKSASGNTSRSVFRPVPNTRSIKETYLQYDLAQKYYNPNYKGSKK